MAKYTPTGRSNRGARHVRIDHSVFYSAPVRALSPLGRALLLEMIGLFNGYNNGRIILSVRDAERLLGVGSDSTVRRAFRELQEHRLLVATATGSFGQKRPHASTWGLTFLHTPGAGPTHDYLSWRAAPGSAAARRLKSLSNCNLREDFTGLARFISETKPANATAARAPSYRVCETANPQNPQNCEARDRAKSETHLDSHLPAPRRAPLHTCKRVRRQILAWLRGRPERTQRQLARLAGVHESKLSRFLNDPHERRTLEVDAVERLSRAMMLIVPQKQVG